MSAQDGVQDGAGGPRVLLAVGHSGEERRLQQELAAAGLEVSGRCLDGPSLLERASEPGSDVVLASSGLHRLSEGVLHALGGLGLPVVLLDGGEGGAARLSGLCRVLPAAAPGAIVEAALRQAAAAGPRTQAPAPGGPGGGMTGGAAPAAPGGPGGAVPDGNAPPAPGGANGRVPDAGGFPDAAIAPAAAAPAVAPPEAAPLPEAGGARGRVLAVASGKGAPGKTTLAIALAALLAERGSEVALMDADLRGGNVAPYLDLDPRRGLVGVAASGGRIDAELQPGPGFSVLAGVERPELASGLGDEALGRAAEALRARFGTVVVDLGAPPSPELLRAADELLLVTGADLVSIWNARTALPAIRARAARAALHAVVNRRDGREHYDSGEVARALGLPVLGVVREEREAARRAVARQVPLSGAGSRVASDLRALASALSVPDAAGPGEALSEADWLRFGLAGRA